MKSIATFLNISAILVFMFSTSVQIFQPAAVNPYFYNTSKMAQNSDHPVTPGAPITPTEYNGDLRNLPKVISSNPYQQHRPLMPNILTQRQSTSNLVVPSIQAQAPTPNMPSSTSFAGLSRVSNGSGWPPDPNGDVGPNHYLEAVNTSIGIFNKTGTLLSTFTFNSFWSGANTGTACDTSNQGDPIVLYDPLADRWIFADMAWTNIMTGPFYECFAVSKTGDPVSGGWWRYPIRTDSPTQTYMTDYPKLSVWSDGIYMSANRFACLDTSCAGNTYHGVRVWVFNRAQMESGATLQSYLVDVGGSYFSLLPSNLRGTPPPAGTPNYFVSLDPGSWALDVWKFHVDWATPANNTFTGPSLVSIASYTSAPASIPQLGSTEVLDSLGDRLMMQNQYRNIGGTESLWITHTVGSGGVSGIRWYQLNVTGGTISNSPVQSSTFQPDANYRWMPSLAVDKMGDMTVGYSVSSTSMNPAIRYAGRLVSDPLNTLNQGEATMIAGAGAQSGGSGRWGDYSAMTVDPTDDCTFWYVNEYYSITGNNWQTQIGSFKFPSCTTIIISGNVGVGGVTLSYMDGVAKTIISAADGSYSLSVSYNWSGTITPSKNCFIFNPTGLSYSNITTNQTGQNYTYSITPGCLPSTGTYDDTHPNWIYSGAWSTYAGSGPYNNTEHYTSNIGSTASFTFSGTGFILYYLSDPSRQQIQYSVDGGAPVTINTHGTTVVWQTTYTSPALSAGTHTVVFSDVGPSGTYIDIDAITILSPVPAGTYDDTNPNWVYSGAWSTYAGSGPYNNTEHYTSNIGSTASFTFSGTGFTLYYLSDPSRQQIQYSVDGGTPVTINTHGTTVVWQTTYASPALSAGTHTVVFSDVGPSGTYIDIDAITIQP